MIKQTENLGMMRRKTWPLQLLELLKSGLDLPLSLAVMHNQLSSYCLPEVRSLPLTSYLVMYYLGFCCCHLVKHESTCCVFPNIVKQEQNNQSCCYLLWLCSKMSQGYSSQNGATVPVPGN